MLFIREALMAYSAAQKELTVQGSADTTVNYHKMLKKRHNLLKNPVILVGTVASWVALVGYLKPHSERVSFAEHRFRIFLQASTFVTMVTFVTFYKRWLDRKHH